MIYGRFNLRACFACLTCSFLGGRNLHYHCIPVRSHPSADFALICICISVVFWISSLDDEHFNSSFYSNSILTVSSCFICRIAIYRTFYTSLFLIGCHPYSRSTFNLSLTMILAHKNLNPRVKWFKIFDTVCSDIPTQSKQVWSSVTLKGSDFESEFV